MRLIFFFANFIVIDLVASDIYFKGDCFPTDALFDPTEFPDWSSCLAFRNESNKCGDGPTAPADIYGAILMRDRWILDDGAPKVTPISMTDCRIDDRIVDPYITLDNTRQKIRLDPDTYDNDADRHEYRGKTNCSWTYGVFARNTRYDLTFNKFVVPGCNDCECGSLDVYEVDRYWNHSEGLEIRNFHSRYPRHRICSHNFTHKMSFHSSGIWGSDFELFLHFQTNISFPQKLEIEVSSTALSKFDEWTQCNVNCGEGFQTRRIINSDKCTATQYRSCWVGACLTEETGHLEFSSKAVSGRCLSLMQEIQENFHFKRDVVAKNCEEVHIEPLNAKYYEKDNLRARSQLQWGRCKPNVTKECINAYHDFLTYSSHLIDNTELKNCYNPEMIEEHPVENGYRRANDFLVLTKDKMTLTGRTMKEQFEFIFDTLEESCKFQQLNV